MKESPGLSSVTSDTSLEKLKGINPDEWNNVPIPVTSAMKIVVDELKEVKMNIKN
jgi:hypothetical protein